MKNTALFDVAKKLLQDRSSKMEHRERLSEEPVHAQLMTLIKHCYANSKDKASLNQMMFLFFGIEFIQLELAVEMELYSQKLDWEKQQYEKQMAMTIEEYYNQFNFKTLQKMVEFKTFYPLTEEEAFELRKPIHEAMALPMEYYQRYPIGKEQEQLEKTMNENFINRNSDFPIQEKSESKDIDVLDLTKYRTGLDGRLEKIEQFEEISFLLANENEKKNILENTKYIAELTQKFCDRYKSLSDLPGGSTYVESKKLEQHHCDAYVKVALKTNGDNELIKEQLQKLRVQISQYKKLPKELRGTLLIEAQDKFNRLKTWLN